MDKVYKYHGNGKILRREAAEKSRHTSMNVFATALNVVIRTVVLFIYRPVCCLSSEDVHSMSFNVDHSCYKTTI